MKTNQILFDERTDKSFVTVANDAAKSMSRFKKEAIRAGTWVHPVHGWAVRVDHSRMDQWVKKFRQMKDAGIQVPMPLDHSRESAKNVGFVEDMMLDGDRLFVVGEVPLADDAKRMGTTIREVSVNINPNFKDGTGREWGEVIDHVSPCTNPVVTGQSNFVALSVGLSGKETQSDILQRKEETVSKVRDTLVAHYKLRAEATDEEVLAAVDAERKEHAKVLTQTKTERDDSVRVTMSLRAENEDLKKKVVKPVDDEISKHPEVIRLRAEAMALRTSAVEQRIQSAVKSGRLSPAVVDVARTLLMASAAEIPMAETKDKSFSLSATTKKSVDELFTQIIEALPENAMVPVSRGTIPMRRDVGTSDVDAARAEELAKENAKMVGHGDDK